MVKKMTDKLKKGWCSDKKNYEAATCLYCGSEAFSGELLCIDMDLIIIQCKNCGAKYFANDIFDENQINKMNVIFNDIEQFIDSFKSNRQKIGVLRLLMSCIRKQEMILREKYPDDFWDNESNELEKFINIPKSAMSYTEIKDKKDQQQIKDFLNGDIDDLDLNL